MTIPVASTATTRRPVSAARKPTLGVVSFINAWPLYQSLLASNEIVIHREVPARLAGTLIRGECEIALLPIVDYWRYRDTLALVSNACIASDGETMTVRVFSKVPPDQVTTLHTDSHSHTSAILARVIWRELFGREIELIPHDTEATDRDTVADISSVLLIGDKVVHTPPHGFGFEVDLGTAWKRLTGLPFVFAAWYGEKNGDFAAMAETLEASRDAGTANAEHIAQEKAAEHGWPQHVALHYLRDVMRYTLTDDMRTAMERFFDLAVRHGYLS